MPRLSGPAARRGIKPLPQFGPQSFRPLCHSLSLRADHEALESHADSRPVAVRCFIQKLFPRIARMNADHDEDPISRGPRSPA